MLTRIPDFVETRRGCLVINHLSIVLGKLNWSGDKVGDVLSNQDIRIDKVRINLLRKV